MKLFERGKPWILQGTPGETVSICQCGESADPPRCDGSQPRCRQGGALEQVFAADGQLWLCGCGHSARLPLCDGSHKAFRNT